MKKRNITKTIKNDNYVKLYNLKFIFIIFSFGFDFFIISLIFLF
jgi:hypothetical protein